MTIPSNNIHDDAYEAVGHGSRGSFSDIAGGFTQQIQQALAKHLDEKGIDIHKLSTQEKHTILTNFIETDYAFDKDLLPNTLKREAIAKENYFLDEILHDSSLGSYTTNTQGSIPMTQAIIVATITNLLALSGLPDAMIQELQDLLEQDRSKPLFTSIDAFRSQLQNILDNYDPKNPSATEKITPEQKKQIMNISTTNNDIIQTLQSEGIIDEETYNTLTSQPYENWPEEYKKVFATQLRKQFTYSYVDGLTKMKEVGAGISGLISVPTIREVVSAYCKKLDIDYSEFVDQQKPGLNFSARSKEEKQALMDTMVEEYYMPNAEKFAARMGLDSDKYKDFVKNLFSLDEKKLTIPGPDGNQIDLSFVHKDISGALTVDSVDGLGDQPIPFSFVVDGAQGQEMQKLASTMPHKTRHTVNGQQYDPQQTIGLQINGKTIQGYAYKIMHGGEEQYIITDKYRDHNTEPSTLRILTKDGEFKLIKTLTEEESLIIPSAKTPESDALHIGPQEPTLYSMKPHDVSGILTAYCLNNSSNLSDADKKELFVEKPKAQKLSNLFQDQILGHDEENTKALENTQQHTGEIDESYQQRMEQDRKMAYKSWSAIPGSKDAKFEKGALIAIQNVDSIFTEIPGNGGYTILELTDCDDRSAPTQFKYKIVGGTETDIAGSDGSSLSGQNSNRLLFTEERFSKLKDFGRGTMYKFPPKTQQGNLLEYAKGLSFDNQGMDEFSGRMDMLTQEDNILKNNRGERIQYFGVDVVEYDEKGAASKGYVMFETKLSGDSVTIKDKNGGYSRQMSFTEFIIFVSDKGLRPYSQKEYDEDILPIHLNNAKSKKAFFVMSPMNIINGAKQWYKGTVVAGIERSQKRREEKIEELFYTSGFTSILGNIPIYGEYFVQAQDEFDTKLADKHHKIVMEGDSTINQWGKKLVRGKETYVKKHNLKDPHRQVALDKIAGFFEKAAQGRALDDVERREAMAGLLYVLEKFQTPYPRSLAKYAGQQLWPKLLLNDKKYDLYMRGFNEAKHKLEQGKARGEDVRELMNNVMQYDIKNMSELMKDEYHRYLYGFKTIPVLQEHGEKRTNDTARKDGMTAAGHHPAFARAYKEEVLDKLAAGLYGYAIGGLIQISKRKELGNPANYRRWLTGVLQMILSGGMRYAASASDRKYLRDFLRKHGMPISDYILDNAQGGKELATLLEVISKNAGCDKTFLEATGWNPSLESYENWSKNNAHSKFNGKMDKRFLGEGNAAKVLPFLENSNLDSEVNLATLAKNPSLNASEKGIVDRYLKASLNADPGRDFDSFKGGDDFVNSIIQDRTIFNVSRQLMQTEYMNYSDGSFGSNEETVGYFWKALENQFAGYARKDTLPKESLELIVTKYYSLFQGSYGGDHQRFVAMLAYMKNEPDPAKKKRYAKAAISNYVRKNKYGVFPAMMSSAFTEIENFFVKHVNAIDDDMIGRLVTFDELSATSDQRKQALQVYDMMKPGDATINHPKQNEAVQKYIADLSVGKISGGKPFTFDELRTDSATGDNNEEGFFAEHAQQQSVQQALAQQAVEESNRKEQLTKDEAKKEAEAMQKKKEEQEAEKQRLAEEQAKKNQPEPEPA